MEIMTTENAVIAKTILFPVRREFIQSIGDKILELHESDCIPFSKVALTDCKGDRLAVKSAIPKEKGEVSEKQKELLEEYHEHAVELVDQLYQEFQKSPNVDIRAFLERWDETKRLRRLKTTRDIERFFED